MTALLVKGIAWPRGLAAPHPPTRAARRAPIAASSAAPQGPGSGLRLPQHGSASGLLRARLRSATAAADLTTQQGSAAPEPYGRPHGSANGSTHSSSSFGSGGTGGYHRRAPNGAAPNGAGACGRSDDSSLQDRLERSRGLLKSVLERRAERLRKQQAQEPEGGAAAAPSRFSAVAEEAEPESPATPQHLQHQYYRSLDAGQGQPNGSSSLNGGAAAAPSSTNGAGAVPSHAAPPRSRPYSPPAAPAAASAAALQHAALPPPILQPLEPEAEPEPSAALQQAAIREDAATQRKTATVRFWLKFRAEWGQRLKVVGTHAGLGEWVLTRAPELKWSEGDNWHVTVQLPAGGVVEYKYVLLDHSGNVAVAWQAGNNSVLAIRGGEELVEVFDTWGGDPGAKVVADSGKPVTRENRLLSWAGEMEAQLVSQRQDLRRARMELASAQQDAREARAEVSQLKARLAKVEGEKREAVSHLAHVRALNDALQVQLEDTTATFNDALSTAASILTQIDEVEAGAPTPAPIPAADEDSASSDEEGAQSPPAATAAAAADTEAPAAAAAAPRKKQQQSRRGGRKSSGPKKASGGGGKGRSKGRK